MLKLTTSEEKASVCKGYFVKEKESVFDLAETLGSKYLENRILYSADRGIYLNNWSDKTVLAEALRDYLRREITTKNTGIPAIVLWWIASYIINYMVEKLMERFFQK